MIKLDGGDDCDSVRGLSITNQRLCSRSFYYKPTSLSLSGLYKDASENDEALGK